MSVDEFIIQSKKTTTLEVLIDFAKKQRMDASVIRALCSKRAEYAKKTKGFNPKKYLKSTVFVIDGKEIRPTEEDVRVCIEKLKEGHQLVYNDLVIKTIREYIIEKNSSGSEQEENKTELQKKDEKYQELKRENEKLKRENEKLKREIQKTKGAIIKRRIR